MKSVATNHFPRVRFEKNQKWLYNPVLKKRFKDRPEERVRLRWVDYLLLETSWKKTRIGFETPLNIRQEPGKLRADLLLYSDSMKPQILIECKSDSVPLNTTTAEQAARYNQEVGAKWLILTNGVVDYTFQIADGKPQKAENPVQAGQENTMRDFAYWSERGFCSGQMSKELRSRITPFLNNFWNHEPDWQTKYLPFQTSWLHFSMSHYYRIIQTEDQKKLAVTIMGHGHFGTYLTAVLNEKRENRGVLIIDLEKSIKDSKKSARLISANQEVFFSALPILEEFFPKSGINQIKKLPEHLIRLFD